MTWPGNETHGQLIAQDEQRYAEEYMHEGRRMEATRCFGGTGAAPAPSPGFAPCTAPGCDGDRLVSDINNVPKVVLCAECAAKLTAGCEFCGCWLGWGPLESGDVEWNRCGNHRDIPVIDEDDWRKTR